jgi:Ca2+-binding EF-hand superfamily protein
VCQLDDRSGHGCVTESDHKSLGLTAAQIEKLKEEFASIDEDGDGQVTAEGA